MTKEPHCDRFPLPDDRPEEPPTWQDLSDDAMEAIYQARHALPSYEKLDELQEALRLLVAAMILAGFSAHELSATYHDALEEARKL